MKRLILFLTLLLPGLTGLTAQSAGSLRLEECYELVMNNDPTSVRNALLQRDADLRRELIEAERRPSISWNASAGIQTEVVDLPFEAPGFPGIDLPLYRAQTTLDLHYTLYDGGLAQARREQETAALHLEEAQVAAELDKWKPQVNEYFFGVLLLREKAAIIENSLGNIDAKIRTLAAALTHGTVLESEVDKLRVERLRLESQLVETRGAARALLAVLGQLTERELSDSVELVVPDLAGFQLGAPLERTELRVFESQKARVLANESLITARWRPKVGAFVQGGLGYPNPLNFFEAEVSPFALAGVNFKWHIFNWDQDGLERQRLTVQSRLIDNQRTAFEHRLDVLEGKFREDIAAVEALLERDRRILELQSSILEKLSSQLDNGIITSTEYLDQVNAEIRARLNLEAHRLQLQQIKVNYLTQRGIL